MRLDELATVKTGLVTARKQAKKSSDTIAKYRQLNLRAINARGYIDDTYLEDFLATERLKAEYLTQPGDLVVRLTTPYTAILIDDKWTGLVIPSHFVAIRSNGKILLPEYLYWLLNTDKVKAELQQNISSTMIGTIKPMSYANLNIEVLSIAEQKKIAELNLLARKELYLLEQLMGQKEIYYKEALNKIQKEMRRKKREDN
ncbi:restriction endonuclease subunit S [Lachnoclostridium sp.]|uniref:restriction endonuclease subunit S n=1 Tax=Lachnoclostridium sp. TaxID=2028282 RepID=UPI00289C0B2F|nr:restriction endonuclease subunit S [Lachnoclostridium sp.]